MGRTLWKGGTMSKELTLEKKTITINGVSIYLKITSDNYDMAKYQLESVENLVKEVIEKFFQGCFND